MSAIIFNPFTRNFDFVGNSNPPPSGVVNIDLDTGSISGNTVTLSGGTTGLTTVAVSGTEGDIQGILVVANGGTGSSSFADDNSLVLTGASGTAPLVSLTSGTSGLFLQSAGPGVAPIWAAPSNALVWTVSSSTTITAAANTGYILTAGSLVTISLPDPAMVGSQFGFMAIGNTTFKVTQDVLQQIQIGNQLTTLGSGGYLASQQRGDTVVLVATDTSAFGTISYIGNIGWN